MNEQQSELEAIAYTEPVEESGEVRVERRLTDRCTPGNFCVFESGEHVRYQAKLEV